MQNYISELHNGIFSFVVNLYQQHCKTMTKEEAKKTIIEYLRELADYFESYEPQQPRNETGE